MEWNADKPIYIQIKETIIAQIIDGKIAENTLLPSIRQLSMDYQINPLTVSKAYQALTDEDIIQKQRGLGMQVKVNARKKLLKQQKDSFLNDEWPILKQKLKRLGINLEELLDDSLNHS